MSEGNSYHVYEGHVLDVPTCVRAVVLKADPVVISALTLRCLVRAFGGPENATEWLYSLADESGRPFGVQVSQDGVISVIKPSSWSWDRALGWVGVHGPEFEAAYGKITVERL